MANRKLAASVHVAGVWYRPGDDVPEDVATQITNPKAWATAAGENDGGDAAASAPTEAGTASGARLAGRVNVAGRWYGPYDPIPDDVAAQITNPKAWEGGKLPGGYGEREITAGTVTTEQLADAAKASVEAADADMAAGPDADESDAAEKPTRGGRGSAKRG